MGAWILSKPCMVHLRCRPIRPRLSEVVPVNPLCVVIADFLVEGTPLPMIGKGFTGVPVLATGSRGPLIWAFLISHGLLKLMVYNWASLWWKDLPSTKKFPPAIKETWEQPLMILDARYSHFPKPGTHPIPINWVTPQLSKAKMTACTLRRLKDSAEVEGRAFPKPPVVIPWTRSAAKN